MRSPARALRSPATTLLAAISFATLLAGAPIPVAGQEPVRISDPDWPPYYFADREDAPPGLAKEILRACLDEVGVEADFVHLPIERMRHYVETGEIDIVTFSYRADREESVTYGSEVLFTDSYRPIVRKGGAVRIDELADFDSVRLGHVNGLRYSAEFHDYVRERQETGEVTVLPSTESAIKMLEAGRIDVFVGTRTNIEWLAREGDHRDLQILEYDIRTGDYFVTVPKSSRRIPDARAFLDGIDACLAAMKADGRVDAILSKYR